MESNRIGSKQFTLRRKLIEIGKGNGKNEVKYSAVAKDLGMQSGTLSNAFRRGLTVETFNKICNFYGFKI